jgi:hypothetical protein
MDTDSDTSIKPAPIFLLVNDETDGPHEAAEILDRLSGSEFDENENPVGQLSVNTLSCIEGMRGWRSLSETLIWSYAKLLAALPQASDWIEQAVDCTLNLRDGNKTIRETLKRTAKIVDWQAPDFIWKAIDANAMLLRNHRDYKNRQQHWDELAMENFPAMELIFKQREFPTRDWRAEWLAAGGKMRGEKMIARKDDSIWVSSSDFGYPFPPIDFDQSVWIADALAVEVCDDGFDSSPVQLPAIKPFQLVGF